MEQAIGSGIWIPISIVSAAFTFIIGLLLYIWNQMLKQNDKRHDGHDKSFEKQDKILEKVSESVESLRVIVTDLKARHEVSTRK